MKVYQVYSHSFTGIFNNPEMKKIKNSIKPNEPYRVVHYPGGTGGAIWNTWSVGYGLEDAGGFGTMVSRRYLELWDLMSFGDYEIARKNKFSPTAISIGFNIDTKMMSEYRQQEKSINFNDYYNQNLLSLMNVKYVNSQTLLESTSFRMIHKLPKYMVTPKYNYNMLKTRLSGIFKGDNT